MKREEELKGQVSQLENEVQRLKGVLPNSIITIF